VAGELSTSYFRSVKIVSTITINQQPNYKETRMNKFTVVTSLVFCVALLAIAQEPAVTERKPESVAKSAEGVTTMTGYVVDAMCAKGMLKKTDVMARAAKHSKACALEEECSSSGYGLLSASKWYKFDDDGDKQAKELIQKSSKENDIMVEVSGKMKDDRFVLASIKEYTMGKSMDKMHKKPDKNYKKDTKTMEKEEQKY
jgi:hypothetical protein